MSYFIDPMPPHPQLPRLDPSQHPGAAPTPPRPAPVVPGFGNQAAVPPYDVSPPNLGLPAVPRMATVQPVVSPWARLIVPPRQQAPVLPGQHYQMDMIGHLLALLGQHG